MHTFARNIHIFHKVHKITLIRTQCTHVQAVPKLPGTLKPHPSLRRSRKGISAGFHTRIAEHDGHSEYRPRKKYVMHI